jgi:hypothetical protein
MDELPVESVTGNCTQQGHPLEPPAETPTDVGTP